MDKVALWFGGIVATIGGLVLLLPLSTLAGAFSGWIVGMFFDDAILGILRQVGVSTTMWKFGAFLGFVGGFLKTKVTAEVKSSK